MVMARTKVRLCMFLEDNCEIDILYFNHSAIAPRDDGSEVGSSHHGSPGNAGDDSCSHHGSPDRSGQVLPKHKRKRCVNVGEALQPLVKKKRVKTNAAKSTISKTKKGTAAVMYTVNSVLESWGETTEYGKSFRSLDQDKQCAEVALLNKGSSYV